MSSHGQRRPTRLRLIQSDTATIPAPPILSFKRSRPRLHWMVPPVVAQLYRFDSIMLAKRLIAKFGDLIVCDGHRFHIIGRDYDEEHRIVRWLVYREDPTLPNEGRP